MNPNNIVRELCKQEGDVFILEIKDFFGDTVRDSLESLVTTTYEDIQRFSARGSGIMNNAVRKMIQEEQEELLLKMSAAFAAPVQNDLVTIITTSRTSYNWAMTYPRHQAILKPNITRSREALNWAINIGDVAEMENIVALSNNYVSQKMWEDHFGSPPQAAG